MGLFFGVFVGVSVTLTFVALAWRDQRLEDSLLVTVLAGAVSGLVAGWWFPFAIGRALHREAIKAREGLGRYAPPPPPADATHRLPSSLVLSSYMAVGGVLYLGESRLTFVPHLANLPRHRTPTEIPCDGLAISVRPATLTMMRRFLVDQRVEHLVLSNAESSWRFVVPAPGQACEALRSFWLAGSMETLDGQGIKNW